MQRGNWTAGAIIAGVIVATAVLDWIAPDAAPWRKILIRLYYLPVVIACLRDGWRGGLAAAVVSGLALVAPALGGEASVPLLDRVVEAVSLVAVAAVTGVLADRERGQKRRYRAAAEQLSAVYEKVQANFEGMKRAERLSALGQLSAGLAHEIRNPLASISGAAGILQRGRNLDSKDARCLEIIINEARRLNGLLTNFLNFARPRPPRFRAVDPGPVLDNVAGLASHAVRGKSIVVDRSMPEGLPAIECDPEQLEQVLLNLVINAIEASPEGESVTLAAEPVDAKVAIHVIDRGCGVAPGDIDRLFDPFFTTKEHGTGLGLPVAHQIVTQMGGVLVARRNDGAGMTFSVLLPATRQDT